MLVDRADAPPAQAPVQRRRPEGQDSRQHAAGAAERRVAELAARVRGQGSPHAAHPLDTRESPVSICRHISSGVCLAIAENATANGGWHEEGFRRPANCAGWPRPRTRSTGASTSTSRGPSPTSPSGSGRSTSTGCTRTSASSSRSWSRRCSRAMFRPAACARPVRGLGDDARAGARVGLRRDRRGRGAVQLPADAREDAGVQPVRARVGAARCARAARPVRARAAERPGLDVRPRLVRAEGGGGAALLPRPRRGLRACRRAEGRAGARGALGAADDALRPRLPAEAAEDAVLVPQAPARVQARRRGSPLPAPVRARHARPREGVRARACARARGGRAPRRRA